jgi:shikimate dehydrogenase
MTDASFLHELVGSMSQGAAGNPTVAVMEAAFANHGLHWRYVNMEVAPDDLAAAVRGAKAMGFRGFNLSIPHKVAVIPLLDGVGESAGLIGAVNCVVRRGEQFIGENTDGKGFLASLQEVIDPRGKDVVLFGAGGAARAVSMELALAGARKFTVVNRGATRGAELAEAIRTRAGIEAEYVPWAGEYRIAGETQIVINGTSIGLYEPETRLPVAVDSLQPAMVVADVVFSPPRTRFLREAAERRCTVLDGLGMLVNQGAIAIQYWTGVNPDRAVMRRTLEQALGVTS